ncbi:flagellar hook-basal body protein [Bacillus massilinigeriensis]|uniref:flagellar hook-basal body protein n=1 Tax=Bacillus mediterraneensis TaxID=1805474 RepID=UPI0008F7F751|nr:flagellar hook-basal body protein [Bacillus mediterraneensis]
MNRTMITATNTLSQLQKQMDIISNNIANSDTNGYKRRDATFTELVAQEFRNQPHDKLEANRLTPFNIRQGNGARLAQSQISMALGSIKTTDRSLDAALTAEGQMFRVLVEESDGSTNVRLTRNGAFYLSPLSDNETMLVNSDGHPVLDEGGSPITFTGNPAKFTISNTGTITANNADGSTQSANLGVVLVKKPQLLEQKGGNLFGLPDNFAGLGLNEEDIFTNLAGGERGAISIQQGALEQSNVDLSKEMTDLINTQRSYQFQSRSINMADQMDGLVNGIR